MGIDVHGDTSLTARWNGTKCSWVRNPSHGAFNDLRAVTTISRGDAWAVGMNAQKLVKILRWNGRRWSTEPDPRITGELTIFNGIATARRGGIWAVGKRTTTDEFHIDKTLTARWTGTKWISVPSPNFGSDDNTLFGVYAPSARSAWAVGAVSDVDTIIEHWNDTKWVMVTP